MYWKHRTNIVAQQSSGLQNTVAEPPPALLPQVLVLGEHESTCFDIDINRYAASKNSIRAMLDCSLRSTRHKVASVCLKLQTPRFVFERILLLLIPTYQG